MRCYRNAVFSYMPVVPSTRARRLQDARWTSEREDAFRDSPAPGVMAAGGEPGRMLAVHCGGRRCRLRVGINRDLG